MGCNAARAVKATPSLRALRSIMRRIDSLTAEPAGQPLAIQASGLYDMSGADAITVAEALGVARADRPDGEGRRNAVVWLRHYIRTSLAFSPRAHGTRSAALGRGAVSRNAPRCASFQCPRSVPEPPLVGSN